jgi:putative SOS response-associated peptidase YedK
VVADGYYEWKKIDSKKQPYLITLPDEQPFAMAGLWESWHGGAGSQEGELHSCTIITTAANETTREVHDRMPVILDPRDWEAWLDTKSENTPHLQELLTPWQGPTLTLRPVSTKVNNPRNDSPDVLVVP